MPTQHSSKAMSSAASAVFKASAAPKPFLIEFYGEECPPCHYVRPTVEKLEKDLGIHFEKLEVWHNEENAERMELHREAIESASGGMYGVPSFYNTRTGKALVGAVDYETLKAFVLAEPSGVQ